MPRLPRLRRRSRAESSSAQPTASDLLSSQSERPLTELDERLQALRARTTGASQAGYRQDLFDVDDLLTTPPLQEKPGGIISAVGLSRGQQQQVDLLTDIATGQQEAPGKTTLRKRSASVAMPLLRALSRLLGAALLLLFVALPFVSSEYAPAALPLGDFPADDPSGGDFFRAMEDISPGDSVLVAVEYGLGAAAELDPLTDLALRHIFARGGRAILVSSNPIAFVHVQNLINDIRASVRRAGLQLTVNRDYVLLRYLPGGALGLRELSENFADILRLSYGDASTNLPVRSLDDLALMLLIAESADDVRNWAEQVLPETGNARLYAATSLAAEPLARVYVESLEAVGGLLVGLRDAYTYGAKLDATLGQATPGATATTAPTTIATAMPTAVATATSTPTVTATATATPHNVLLKAETARETPWTEPTPSTFSSAVPSPTDSPQPTATATPALIRAVEVVSLQSPVNIRTGPSTTYETLGLAYRGDIYAVLDANSDASWYKIRMANGWEGWIAAILVDEQMVAQTALSGNESASVPRAQTLLSAYRPRRYSKTEPRFAQVILPVDSAQPAFVQLRERGGESARLQALTMGTLAAVLAIVIGNLVAMIVAFGRRR